MHGPHHLVVTTLLALLLAACTARPPACATGQQAWIGEQLYFGAASPQGEVSLDAWNAFLRDVVTPRFPDGLTTWQAAGQWRSADGTLTREPAYILDLVHAGDAAAESSVLAIIDTYKSRHRQEAVLRVRTPVCVSF